MSVVIENLTSRPVLLRLNSGKTLHVRSRATSTEIGDAEVNNNTKVQKLRDRHIISLHEAGKRVGSAASKKEKQKSAKQKSESTKKKVTV